MCGIGGAVGDVNPAHAAAMLAALRHRGPDGEGSRHFPEDDIWLGHTRLSILDLSSNGDQPMADASGRVWITYNGEIYNHPEIRRQLEGKYRFRGHSDTETILYAYLEWGRDCISRFNGMFAFAIWDSRSRELWLARDRFGIKPLYYAQIGSRLRFASEVKAVLADPIVPRVLDVGALDSFLRLRYVVHPRTLARDVKSLPPGHQLVWRDGNAKISAYWRPDWNGSTRLAPEEARMRFSAKLQAAVGRAMLSDVPVGVFLSGGLDSSLVTALMRTTSSGPIASLSIGFEGDRGDAKAAREVASILGCDHHAIECRAADISTLAGIVRRIDQPVGDSVILPTYQLAAYAQGRVKTVMTGEGADELLMGYAHQSQLAKLARLAPLFELPGPSFAFGAAVRILPVAFWNRFFNYGADLGRVGVDRLAQLGREMTDAVGRYMTYVSLFGVDDRHALYQGPLRALAANVAPGDFDTSPVARGGRGVPRGYQESEFQAWLPDNILTKQDSLSMANGIETRVPYLDNELVDEVLSWDTQTFQTVASGKDILHRMLAQAAPALPRRPKNAFRLDADGAYAAALIDLAVQTIARKDSPLSPYIARGYVDKLLKTFSDGPFLRGKQLAALAILDLWVTEQGLN